MGKSIEVPITLGETVRLKGTDDEFVVTEMQYFEGEWCWSDDDHSWLTIDGLEVVVPVIEWSTTEVPEGWEGRVNGTIAWFTYPSGALFAGDVEYHIGKFTDPKAVAEATQKLWNEAAKAGE
jgi:hypothetical protein